MVHVHLQFRCSLPRNPGAIPKSLIHHRFEDRFLKRAIFLVSRINGDSSRAKLRRGKILLVITVQGRAHSYAAWRCCCHFAPARTSIPPKGENQARKLKGLKDGLYGFLWFADTMLKKTSAILSSCSILTMPWFETRGKMAKTLPEPSPPQMKFAVFALTLLVNSSVSSLCQPSTNSSSPWGWSAALGESSFSCASSAGATNDLDSSPQPCEGDPTAVYLELNPELGAECLVAKSCEILRLVRSEACGTISHGTPSNYIEATALERSDNKNNIPPLFKRMILQLVASLLALTHTAFLHN